MVLKALEMQGFKSFPDKTVLTFGSGMTSVVGPNGSGKSNISDAVRWVLGEQSSKTLRGSRMEDVIFSGTDERRAMGYAEVTLRLDNTDRALDKDTDEVAVTRRYYRSGESEYKINGETARLRDIHELFMDTGLGRDGYSIVSQGKVADMVSSKSNQRRDMLEEAAGISHYRYRRTDAMRRLDQAEENLVRLRDILSELESRVGPLKTQSEKAQKFLVLAEQKKTLEISLWLYNIENTKNRLKDQEHKIDLATAQYNDAETELNKIEEKIEAAIAAVRGFTLDIDRIRASSAELDEKTAELNAQIAVGENTLEHNQQNIDRVRRDMETADLARAEVEKSLEESFARIDALKEEIASRQEGLSRLDSDTAELSASSGKVTDQTDELNKALQETAEQIADFRVKRESALSSIEEIKDRIARADETAAERKELLAGLKKQDDEAAARLKAAAEAVQSAENAISGYELRRGARKEKAETKREASERCRRAAEEAESRIRMLEDLEKNMEGYTGSVKAVVKESGRGTLKGIRGTLSRLITVDDKYAAAIETALGAAVQHVVVDSENDAKAAIRYLKNSKAGRATFLPVSAIKGRDLDEKDLDDCYGYIDIASNLVKTDKKYQEIIRNQLGRTVVVEDMESAIAMGRKYKNRFRIVTLDGQVINAGGSMTGGSRVKNAGLMSRSGQIETLKKDLEKLEAKFREADEAAKAAEEEAARAEAELEAARAELTTASEEKVHAESARELSAGQLESVRTALAELEEEQANADKRIAELTKEAESAKAEEDKQNKRAETLSKQLAGLAGDLDKIREATEEKAQTRAQAELDILALTKDLEAAEERLAALQESNQSSEERKQALEAEIASYEKASEETRAEMESLRTQVDNLRSSAGESQSKIEDLTVKREEAEAENNKLRVLERNKTTEREAIGGELARLTERKAGMLREHEDTINKLYEEYELTHREAAELSAPTEDPAGTRKELAEVRGSIKNLGSVNVGAIEEYQEVSERYEFLSAQIHDVETSRKELLDLINELTGNMARQFGIQFNRINAAFGQTFRDLFGGGRAELRLEDDRDLLESPIEIRVQPPGKNVQNIDLLSGGEKGLSAIALLFAILKITPAPFCIFDEVEAALDDVNVRRFAQYVRNMTNNTQFILITHRRGTMEEADVLYGVTMEEEGVSKLLELKTAELAKSLGLPN